METGPGGLSVRRRKSRSRSLRLATLLLGSLSGMTELKETYQSIQETLSDYRRDEGYEVTIDRINEWAQQFKQPAVDLPMLDRPLLLRAVARPFNWT